MKTVPTFPGDEEVVESNERSLIDNRQAASLFKATGDLLQILGESRFVVMAYQNAARTIDSLEDDINAVAEAGGLQDLPRIGKAIAEKIETLLATGSLPIHDEAAAQVPEGVAAMLQVPDVGPKTVQRLWRELDITSIDMLKDAAQEGKLRALKGFGAKTEQRILKSIDLLNRRSDDRTPIGASRPMAETLAKALEEDEEKGVFERIEIVGSLRRWRETTGEIRLLATSEFPERALQKFSQLPHVTDTTESKPSAVTVSLRNGPQATLTLVEEEDWGTSLCVATGSNSHLDGMRAQAEERGWQFGEFGFASVHGRDGAGNGTPPPQETADERLCFDDEEALYKFLGMKWVPPELREGGNEVAAAMGDALPELISAGAIAGELHGHTTWSDGKSPVADMAEAARGKGYRYWAVTDHSVGLGVTQGVDAAALAEQRKEIDAANAYYADRGVDFRLLQGTEVEVLGDGTLGLSDEVLASLDIVVASIHSGLRQDSQRITERCLRAVENPFVDIIGHPTGRLLGRRPPSEIDLEQVFLACAATGTAVEINANPERLDLSAEHARMAADLGCAIVINCDAHSIGQFDLLPYGIHTARRAWLRAQDVLNARPLDEMLAMLKRNRSGRSIK